MFKNSEYTNEELLEIAERVVSTHLSQYGFVFCYGRMLSADEINTLYDNPFVMFKRSTWWKVWRKEMKDKLIVKVYRMMRKIFDCIT